MANTKSVSKFHPQGRHDRMLQEWKHDTYQSKYKLNGPAVCPDCGAIFRNGRWQWDLLPDNTSRALCPACHRIQDKVPAGFLNLGGSFLAGHSEEIMNLIRHVEHKEMAVHPLKRIMDISAKSEGMVITFTDPHLARDVGEALYDAYKGELDFAYQPEERILRVYWNRG